MRTPTLILARQIDLALHQRVDWFLPLSKLFKKCKESKCQIILWLIYDNLSSPSIIKLQKLPLIVSFFEGNVPFKPLSSFSSEIRFPTLSLHHSMSSLTLLVSLNSFEIRTVPFSPEIKKCGKCYCKKFDVFDMLCVAIRNSKKLFTR